MISYDPMYATMQKRGITEYAMVNKHGIPKNTMQRMRHGEAISTETLDTLCFILNCEVSDILKYVKDE